MDKYAKQKKYKEGKQVIQAFAPKGLRREFKMACFKSGQTMREVILNAVDNHIKEWK